MRAPSPGCIGAGTISAEENMGQFGNRKKRGTQEEEEKALGGGAGIRKDSWEEMAPKPSQAFGGGLREGWGRGRGRGPLRRMAPYLGDSPGLV